MVFFLYLGICSSNLSDNLIGFQRSVWLIKKDEEKKNSNGMLFGIFEWNRYLYMYAVLMLAKTIYIDSADGQIEILLVKFHKVGQV